MFAGLVRLFAERIRINPPIVANILQVIVHAIAGPVRAVAPPVTGTTRPAEVTTSPTRQVQPQRNELAHPP